MSRVWNVLSLSLLFALAGCATEEAAHDHDADHGHDHADGGHDHDDGGHDHGDDGHDDGGGGAWAVTAWGEHFEIFAEADPLVAGETARSLTHVTVLRDFSALREGLVEIVFRREGEEQVFAEELPLRDGIFDVAMRPEVEGEYELFFRVEGPVRKETISAGTVRVGTAGDPGGLREAGGGEAGVDPISFGKEQQWRTPFSTAAAREGELHHVARGPGRVRPVAGGEIDLAASMSARVVGEPWPHVGMDVEAGDRLFALTPHVAADRSLAELGAVETEKTVALGVAEDRLNRLESLLPLQAASPAEVDAARAQVTALRAQLDAARKDLRTAKAGRAGGLSGESVPVSAPFAGQVAEVRVSPGQVVAAGETLGRVVRVEPFWVEVFLRPAQAMLLDAEGVGLALRGPGMAVPVSIAATEVRLVSRAPEVSPVNGTVTCVFEVAGNAAPLLGTAVEAEVTLPETQSGIVVPAASVVDDGGTPVIYTQIDGETFARREVEVLAREGASLLVRGIRSGERVVTNGGSTIRRATLVASGVGHGHVH